jgi:uncharacterized membrane protein
VRHPLHPALVHFPIAFWTLAVVADFTSLHFGESAWHWSAGLLTVGCGMAVPAMLVGLLELTRVPEGPPLRDAYYHIGAMLLAFTLFTTRLVLGLEQLQAIAPNAISLWLDAGGFIALVVGGGLGSRLVYRHGVAVG